MGGDSQLKRNRDIVTRDVCRFLYFICATAVIYRHIHCAIVRYVQSLCVLITQPHTRLSRNYVHTRSG